MFSRSQDHGARITRLMALVIRIQELVDCDEVADYAEMARHSQVTRAGIDGSRRCFGGRAGG
jgi:hypothetical protein